VTLSGAEEDKLKSVALQVLTVLDETIKTVIFEYIKSRSLQSRLFPTLCSAMEATHTTPTAPESQVAVSRFCELRGELIIVSRLKSLSWLSWLTCPGFLADISKTLNILKSMQGKN
jgi:hypothetical protein